MACSEGKEKSVYDPNSIAIQFLPLSSVPKLQHIITLTIKPKISNTN